MSLVRGSEFAGVSAGKVPGAPWELSVGIDTYGTLLMYEPIEEKGRCHCDLRICMAI